MAVIIKKWNNTSATEVSEQYVVFKDENFGDLYHQKRIYGFGFTMKKAGSTIARNAILKYSIDGGYSFINTEVPSSSITYSSAWTPVNIMLDNPIDVQSIQFKIIPGTPIFQGNDFHIIYRMLHKKTEEGP